MYCPSKHLPFACLPWPPFPSILSSIRGFLSSVYSQYGEPRGSGGKGRISASLGTEWNGFQGKAYRSYFNKTPASYIISLRSLQGGKAIKHRDTSGRLHLWTVNHTAPKLQVHSEHAGPPSRAPATQSTPALPPAPQPHNDRDPALLCAQK